MKMKNKTYDALKFIAQILLPAIGTLYFALANIWALPYAEEIVGTITAVDAFLGAILGISTANYRKDQAPDLTIPEEIADEIPEGYEEPEEEPEEEEI